MTSEESQRISQALRALAANRQDDEAWRAVVHLTFPIALATANRVMRGSLDLAKDAVWDAYARIARYADLELLALTAPEPFLKYLKQVTRRACYDLLHHLSRRAGEVQGGLAVLEDTVPSDIENPEDVLAAAELSAEITAVLSEKQRRLLALLLDGLSLREISAKLGISYSAAGVRLFRMRQKIRKQLARTNSDGRT